MEMSRIYADDRSGGFAAALPDDTDSAEILAAEMLVARLLDEAAQGDVNACFDLGVAYSTRSRAIAGDLIEAHKWFNLAAVAGHECAKTCRAEIAGEMTSFDIAEAQRRAREWIVSRRSA